MSKYADYDMRLFRLIKEGCNTFDALEKRLRERNKKLRPGADDHFRVTDQRLQALRRKGVIEYLRYNKTWALTSDV